MYIIYIHDLTYMYLRYLDLKVYVRILLRVPKVIRASIAISEGLKELNTWITLC